MTTVNFPVCRALRASDVVPREGLAPFDRDGEDDAEGCREENLRSSIDSLFRVDGDRAGTARLGSLVFRRRSPLSAGLGDQAEPTTNFRGMTGLIARIRYVSHHCCSFLPLASTATASAQGLSPSVWQAQRGALLKVLRVDAAGNFSGVFISGPAGSCPGGLHNLV